MDMSKFNKIIEIVKKNQPTMSAINHGVKRRTYSSWLYYPKYNFRFKFWNYCTEIDKISLNLSKTVTIKILKPKGKYK